MKSLRDKELRAWIGFAGLTAFFLSAVDTVVKLSGLPRYIVQAWLWLNEHVWETVFDLFALNFRTTYSKELLTVAICIFLFLARTGYNSRKSKKQFNLFKDRAASAGALVLTSLLALAAAASNASILDKRFAALQGLIVELRAIPYDELTDEQREQLIRKAQFFRRILNNWPDKSPLDVLQSPLQFAGDTLAIIIAVALLSAALLLKNDPKQILRGLKHLAIAIVVLLFLSAVSHISTLTTQIIL